MVQKGSNVERTDRELLELASTAAGFEIEDDEFRGEVVFADDGKRWAPLHDDGDALRLAVKLGILDTSRNELLNSLILEEQRHHLRDAATRRAIVRAAAEIGSTMQDVRQPILSTERPNEQKGSEATNE